MSDPLDQPALSRSIWVFAATLALCAHVALGAFAITHLSESDDPDLGAPGLEIGVELAAPRSPPSDLPPGPESEAAMASPQVVQQQKEIKENELPKEVPTEAEDLDRLVTQNAAKKPDEVQPDVKEQPAPPSEASVAQEATSNPNVESAVEAPKSVTRDPGIGESKQRIQATWQRELVAHLDRHKRYPADRSSRNADILVSLVLDRTGKVVSAKVLKSSGDSAFDDAALAMIRRADPVPAPPALVANDGLSFLLPVNFRLKSQR